MKKEGMVRYFLGANSALGFHSLYPEWIDPQKASAIYILKGGPGCGKSTLMRRVAEQMEAEGRRVEYILCSGDPDSLDGIFLPEKGVAVADGTSPHVMEPPCPGALGHYINLEACYEAAGLFPLRTQLLRTETAYRACYPRAYQCFRAAAEVLESGQAAALRSSADTKLEKRVKSLLKREIHQHKTTEGTVQRRFLSALTCQGRLFLRETAEAQCKKIYELQDACGLAPRLLEQLLRGFVSAGYAVIACPSPLMPQSLEHLLIPELSLAFLTLPPKATPKRSARQLSLDNWVDKELLRAQRPRLRFSRRIAEELIEDGIHSLSQAKEHHDALEQLYQPFVSFERADSITRDCINAIRDLPDRLPSPKEGAPAS